MDKTELLIEEVRKNECLFDLSSGNYKNVIKKTEIWKGIAETVALSEDECRKRWQGLRDTYKRRRRAENLAPGSGAPNPGKRWKYLNTLSFLDNFRNSRATVGSIEEVVAEVLLDCSTTSDESAREDSSQDDYTPDDNARSVFSDVGPSGSRVRKPTKRQADTDVTTAFRELMHECAGTLKELGKTTCPEDTDATTSLFVSLAKRIKGSNLTKDEVRRVEGKVVALVYSELDDIARKE